MTMKQMSLLLAIALVGLAVGLLAGWSSNNYRYRVSQDELFRPLPRTALPVAPKQDFCLYAGEKYRHGEMIRLEKMKVTQICVVDESVRWATIPGPGQTTVIKYDDKDQVSTILFHNANEDEVPKK
jgi:hypothetical protein